MCGVCRNACFLTLDHYSTVLDGGKVSTRDLHCSPDCSWLSGPVLFCGRTKADSDRQVLNNGSEKDDQMLLSQVALFRLQQVTIVTLIIKNVGWSLCFVSLKDDNSNPFFPFILQPITHQWN
ncbi:hypothetical protein AMECASPLE_038558 [Ameca splendens]|uniref:Uncharacterized protein n=1 Tax=Ameca splendens TaxID=208324 RepID=A0ABV0ZUK6_9TELE